MMAFRFRKFRHSLRLIPTTKSLGFSTRVNEGDQAKSSSSPERNSLSKPDQGPGQFDPSTATQGQSLFPLTRSVTLPGALQVVDSSSKQHSVGIVSLPRVKDDGQCSFDDIELLLTRAKPVTFTCDDILPASEERCENSSTTDLTWERATVNVIWPSSHFKGPEYSTQTRTNFHNFSYTHSNHHSFSNDSNKRKILHDHHATDLDNFHTFLFSMPNPQDSNCSSSSSDNTNKTQKDGLSPEQLQDAREKLEKTIPTMFTGRYDYSVLHKDVVFENNLFGSNTVQRGVTAYALELLKLRFKFYARYTSTHTEVLNVTTQEQNGVIRIHWRLKGLPQTQVLKFWRLFQSKQEINKEDWEWIEAFSYFHLRKDGLVHKHRIDTMLPDGEEPNKLSERLTKLLNPAKPLVS